MGVAGNRRRLNAHERRTAALLLAVYGTHQAVLDWTRRIPAGADPTDPNLTTAVFAFRAGLVGVMLSAQDVISRAAQIAAEQGHADALAAVSDFTDPSTGAPQDSGTASTPYLEQIVTDAPSRLAGALMARLGTDGPGSNLTAAAAGVIAATAARLLLVARQAIIDAYRAAQAAVFAQAPDVEGWVWTSMLDPTTCAFCYMMHGTWHTADENLSSHPFCQCVQVPTTLKAAEYAQSDPQFGTDLFAALGAAQQQDILGPGRFALYSAGMPLTRMAGDRGMLPLRDLRRTA